MRRIRSRGTELELAVRRLVHSMGYRYRLHRNDLPGCPDLAFSRRKKVIFVHGCFWHQHKDPNCKIARVPKSRPEYWLPKLQRNVERDALHQIRLRKMGWDVLVVWECQTKDRQILADRIKDFLDGVVGG